ncbi:MAG: DMT family transporter [Candidatus Bathyarchaeota archaeon]|nr:DMT family transporter [Candidatus Bathyarchaeota archaeon]
MAGDRGYGTAAAITVSIIWGLSFVAASMVLTTLSPVILATVRFIIAAAIYSPVIVWEYRRGNRPSLADLKELALFGFLSISIYFWLQYTGVQYAGAGVSAVLVTGLIPVLTGLAGAVLLKERFNLRRGLGIALGLTGVALIALPKLIFGSVDWLFLVGVACLLGNAVCWSMYSTLSRRLMKRIGKPLMVTAYTTLWGMLFLLPMSLTSDWGALSALTTSQWVSILYLAVVCSTGGYFLWNYALSRTEAVKASVWLYLEPVAAFIGSFALFGVVPTPLTMLGGAAILIGALLTSLSKQ